MKIIVTAVKARAQAKKISDALLSKRLAACVSFWKIDSSYRWKGKIVHGTEYHIECKCADAKAAKTSNFIQKNHPYSVPMVYTISVSSVAPKYSNWLNLA